MTQGKVKKCILVIGTERSGSTLMAKTCAKALDNSIKTGSVDSGDVVIGSNYKVIHKSLPEHLPPVFVDLNEIILLNESQGYQVYLVICIRDITLSEYSRIKHFLKSKEQVKNESNKAKEMILDIMDSHKTRYFLWSYETFVYLGPQYLQEVYQFLQIESSYSPTIIDGNRATIKFSIAQKIRLARMFIFMERIRRRYFS